MINPFALYTPLLLETLYHEGKQFFIRQNYPRGIEKGENILGSFVITAYTDLGNAEEHFATLNNDPYRFFYYWDTQDHRARLRKAAAQPEGYRVYAPMIKDYKWKVTTELGKKIMDHVKHKEGWWPKKSDNVNVALFVKFGEPCLRITGEHKELQIPLTAVDKIES